MPIRPAYQKACRPLVWRIVEAREIVSRPNFSPPPWTVENKKNTPNVVVCPESVQVILHFENNTGVALPYLMLLIAFGGCADRISAGTWVILTDLRGFPQPLRSVLVYTRPPSSHVCLIRRLLFIVPADAVNSEMPTVPLYSPWIRSSIHSSINSLIHSHIYSPIYSFTHPFSYSLTQTFTHPFILSLTRTYTHLLIYSLLHTFIRSPIHNLLNLCGHCVWIQKDERQVCTSKTVCERVLI
jgi:hypothetical protein